MACLTPVRAAVLALMLGCAATHDRPDPVPHTRSPTGLDAALDELLAYPPADRAILVGRCEGITILDHGSRRRQALVRATWIAGDKLAGGNVLHLIRFGQAQPGVSVGGVYLFAAYRGESPDGLNPAAWTWVYAAATSERDADSAVDAARAALDRAQRKRKPAPSSTRAAHRVALRSGETLVVEDGVAILREADGATVAKNARIIRGPQPDGRCPVDGFRSVEAAGDDFLVRHVLCDGRFFVLETMTFTPGDGGYRLSRFSAEYIDRGSSDKTATLRVLTEAELRIRRFEDVDPDELYPMLD